MNNNSDGCCSMIYYIFLWTFDAYIEDSIHIPTKRVLLIGLPNFRVLCLHFEPFFQPPHMPIFNPPFFKPSRWSCSLIFFSSNYFKRSLVSFNTWRFNFAIFFTLLTSPSNVSFLMKGILASFSSFSTTFPIVLNPSNDHNKTFTKIWICTFGFDCAHVSNLFFSSCSKNYSPIDEMPLSFYYPTLNESQHQLIVYNVGKPIDLPIQCVYLLLCKKRQKWICGFENFDIAKDFGIVRSSYLFICHIMFGSNPSTKSFLTSFKNWAS